MPTRAKGAPKSLRQSVTIPAPLAKEVRRVAKQQHVTLSRALVNLAERGVRAEAEEKQQLQESYDRFMSASDAKKKLEAGQDLIRAIFGPEAIAKNPVR